MCVLCRAQDVQTRAWLSLKYRCGPIVLLCHSIVAAMPASFNPKELPPKRGDSTTPSISSVSNGDVTASSQQKADAKKELTPQIPRASIKHTTSGKPTSSALTTATNDAAFEVDWESESDPENPRNWSIWYKALATGAVSWGTWVYVS